MAGTAVAALMWPRFADFGKDLVFQRHLKQWQSQACHQHCVSIMSTTSVETGWYPSWATLVKSVRGAEMEEAVGRSMYVPHPSRSPVRQRSQKHAATVWLRPAFSLPIMLLVLCATFQIHGG
jgi:hypothetical protein